jgi:hypothetical protein
MPVIFRDQQIACGYRIDLLVEDRVVVELKTVAKLEPVHFAQVMTYLKLSGCEVGLLINFNEALLKDGLRRVVRSHPSPRSSFSDPSSVSVIDSVRSVDSVDSVDSV